MSYDAVMRMSGGEWERIRIKTHTSTMIALECPTCTSNIPRHSAQGHLILASGARSAYYRSCGSVRRPQSVSSPGSTCPAEGGNSARQLRPQLCPRCLPILKDDSGSIPELLGDCGSLLCNAGTCDAIGTRTRWASVSCVEGRTCW